MQVSQIFTPKTGSISNSPCFILFFVSVANFDVHRHVLFIVNFPIFLYINCLIHILLSYYNQMWGGRSMDHSNYFAFVSPSPSGSIFCIVMYC